MKTGNMDDFAKFELALEKAMEKGYIIEDGEVAGIDFRVAVDEVVEMLERWGLIVFMDEN